ncbi:MAG: transposase [Actinomycetia bacterium]|nr:transposase [Actinomycetes bacterium]
MSVAAKNKKYTPEFRQEAAREVVEKSRSISEVARELGVLDTTLGNWVRVYRQKHKGNESALDLPDRARLRELERENRELKQKLLFLEKVAAYFASGQR